MQSLVHLEFASACLAQNNPHKLKDVFIVGPTGPFRNGHTQSLSLHKFPMARTDAGRFGDLMELAVSIVEAARRAGVGRSSVYDAIGRGDLKCRKIGRRSLVLVDDLKAWVSSMPEAKLRKVA